jgi:hypothetical protein
MGPPLFVLLLLRLLNKSNTINGTLTTYSSIGPPLFVLLLLRLLNKRNTINGTLTTYSSLA